MSQFHLDTTHGIILCKARLANNKQAIVTKLAIDTGASLTMISIETALSIGIDPSKSRHHIEITSANGIIFVPILTIPDFGCFGISIRNIDVICHNLPSESCVEGLLGLDFLKKAKIIIDFSRNIIVTPE